LGLGMWGGIHAAAVQCILLYLPGSMTIFHIRWPLYKPSVFRKIPTFAWARFLCHV